MLIFILSHCYIYLKSRKRSSSDTGKFLFKVLHLKVLFICSCYILI